MGVIYTEKGINKLLSLEEYTLPIDKFYWCYSTGRVNYKQYSNEKCTPHQDYLEVYVSSQELINLSGAESSIDDMGRAKL